MTYFPQTHDWWLIGFWTVLAVIAMAADFSDYQRNKITH